MKPYDADAIIKDEVSRLTRFFQHLEWRLYFVPTADPVPPMTQSPIGEEIKLLCRVANGEIDRATADELTVGEVAETIQGVCETLFVAPGGTYAYVIPNAFWETQLGEVVARCQLWVRDGNLIGISDAAKILRGSASQSNLMYVRSLINAGRLSSYPDFDEPNPQRRTRLSRVEVEAFASNGES